MLHVTYYLSLVQIGGVLNGMIVRAHLRELRALRAFILLTCWLGVSWETSFCPGQWRNSSGRPVNLFCGKFLALQSESSNGGLLATILRQYYFLSLVKVKLQCEVPRSIPRRRRPSSRPVRKTKTLIKSSVPVKSGWFIFRSSQGFNISLL